MTEERDQELNRYWNTLVASDGAVDDFALAADEVETVRRLHRAAASLPAGRRAEDAWPGVLARILAADTDIATATGERSAWDQWRRKSDSSVVPNGREHGAAVPAPTPHQRRGPWRLRPAMLATAALLLLTFTAGLVTIGPLRVPTPDGVSLPAADNTGIAVGQFESLWQVRGTPERLDDPRGLAIDGAGNIWVVDASRGSMDIFAADGTFLESWGAPGAGEGQFDFAADVGHYGYGDIAFGPNGAIFVLDSGNHRVQKFAADRRFLLSWGGEGEADGQFLRPVSIAVDRSGAVYVSDEARGDIQVFDSQGRFLNVFGSVGVEEGQLILPRGIAVDPSGMLWVVDRGNNRLQQFDAAGNVHAIVGRYGADPGQLNTPEDIAVDGLGRLYIAEEGMSQVQVLSQDGRPLAAIEGYADNSLFSPLGVAVAPDGAVYVSDTAGLKAFRVMLPTSALLMP